MATLALDDALTGAAATDLSSHAADTGGTWVAHADKDIGCTVALDGTGIAYSYANTSANAIYYSPATLSDANQELRATLIRKGAYNTNLGIRMYCRMHTGTLATNPAYMLLLANNNASYLNATLYKYVGGVLTALGSGTLTMTVDANVVVSLMAVGTTVLARTSTDNGVTWSSLVAAVTDSSVTNANKFGVAMTDIATTASNGINIAHIAGYYGAVLPVQSLSLQRAGARATRGLYTR